MTSPEGESAPAELARLRRVLDEAADAYVCADAHGRVVDCNQTAEDMFGWDRADLVGSAADVLVPERLRDDYRARREQLLDGTGRPTQTLTFRTRHGAEALLEVSAWTTRDDDGTRLVHALCRDVTVQAQLEQKVESQARRLEEAQRIAGLGSWEWEIATDRSTWSGQMHRIFDVPVGKRVARDDYLGRIHPDDRGRVAAVIDASVSTGERSEYDARVVRTDGEVRWVTVRGEVVLGPDGRPVRKAGTVLDITDRKAAQDDVERLASTDSLTGLANRERFRHLLDDALDDGDGVVAVLTMDLDGFKDINDGLGHDVGDLALAETAARLRDAVAAHGPGHVARLGGDEFGVLLSDAGSVEDAITVAVAARDRLSEPYDLSGITVHVNASVGIATSPDHGDDGVTLLKRADVSMYRAKALGCGWAVFDAASDDVATERLGLVADLRDAIESDAIDVAYQPIVDAATRHPVKFEALARWHHHTRGAIGPDQFIPLAEQAGLIAPLTANVVRRATAECARWRAAGHDASVAVNLSVRVLDAADPVEMVRDALAASGLPGDALCVEVTESAFASDTTQLHATLRKLREDVGATVAVDDFGTGYSAMAYLRDLPIDILKVDRSFVSDITSHTRSLSIVRSLTRLAHSLELTVIAEGAETGTAVDTLAHVGVDWVQGYAISRPMPGGDVVAWLGDNAAARDAARTDRRPTDLLVVDDSPTVRAYLATVAADAGWDVREADCAEDALEQVEASVPDVIVLDHQMPGMTGVEAIPAIRARGFDGPILLFTQFLRNGTAQTVPVPLDVWPVSKDNPDVVVELLAAYRAHGNG